SANPPTTAPHRPTSAINSTPNVVLSFPLQIVTLASLAALGRYSFDPVILRLPCVFSLRRRSPERLRILAGKNGHLPHHNHHPNDPHSPLHHSRFTARRQRPRRCVPHRRSPYLPLRR